MKKILLTYHLFKEELEELHKNFEVIMPEEKNFSRAQVLDMIEDFEVLVPNFGFYTDKEIMDKGKKLELIANYGVGFDNIDVDYATHKGITVTNVPHSVLEPTAEMAFALLLAAGRRIGYYDRKMRTPHAINWGLYEDAGLPIYGKTLGIIGMGRIGQAIARRAVASGMSIVYHNRNRLDTHIEQKYNARYLALDELLRQSDYISLNAPSTKETKKMMSTAQFEMMKPTAVFVNTARGDLVDEEALITALKNKTIFAAGLDVFENEPKIRPEFATLDNVVLAPHAGTKTVAARRDMAREMADNILGFYNGAKSISKVN